MNSSALDLDEEDPLLKKKLLDTTEVENRSPFEEVCKGKMSTPDPSQGEYNLEYLNMVTKIEGGKYFLI